jgi:hypothetical protein
MQLRDGKGRIWLLIAVLVALAFVPPARADATLLLEEPYGHLGAFTATGHAAVYLSRVCADSPTVLRRCADDETGIVISRYNKIAGYDWLAIPLIPYLYAVEESDQIPLFANPKLVAFLRNQYRRKHLETIAPDATNGEPPNGNWTQLVGAAYDRTIYGFSIETTAEQDDEFIRQYNARSNRSHFNLVAHNCADFSREVVNFYYPKALHRNLIADAGVTTPKQDAKLLVRFSTHHPELQSSSFVIPQVPGTMPRSTPVHGVVESVLKSKKYLLPVAVLHPVIAGFLAAAYIGDGRFDPAKHAMVFESGNGLEPPLAATERRSYESDLRQLLAQTHARRGGSWEGLQGAEPQLDEDGKPELRVRYGEGFVNVGIVRDNILNTTAPPNLTEGLLTARLQTELRRGDPRASGNDVLSDWRLLRQIAPPPKSLD